MGHYIARRVLQVPVTLWFVSVVVFLLMHIVPGDPARMILGEFATPEDVQALRHKLNLDAPLHVQYLSWSGDLLRGDLGTSIVTGRSVTSMLLERAPYSIALALMATVVSLILALPLGVIAAKHHNRTLDQMLMVLVLVGMTLPSFVVAVVLILVVAVWMDALPISGARNPFLEPVEAAKYFILPVTALSLIRTAQFTRFVRSSMLEVLGQEYVQVARAKGLSERQVIVRHALRNSLIPVVTVATLSFATTLGATVVVESIFSIPGLGQLMLNAIIWRDFTLVQGITLVMAAIFIAVNLVTDVLYGVIDPRIRYG